MITIFDQHFYKVSNADGTTYYVPSVTTILGVLNKAGLTNWYKQVGLNADVIMNDAAERGSRIHEAIDMAIKGKQILYSPKNIQYHKVISDNDIEIEKDTEYIQIYRALNFLNSLSYDSIKGEQNFVSNQYNYGGTIDVVIDLSYTQRVKLSTTTKVDISGCGIIDWKTGNPYPEHLLQVSAYAKMLEENTGKKVEWAMVFYTNTKSKFGWSAKVLESREIDKKFAQFLNVKKVYDDNPLSAPREYDIPFKIALYNEYQPHLWEQK